jgi:integrase
MPTRDKNGVRYQPRRVPPPTEEQVHALADAMPRPPLRALVLCMAYSGLRISEACALHREDVSLDGELLVRKGKGRREGHVECCVVFEVGLDAVLQLGVDKGPLFLNFDGRPYNKDTANRHWAAARKRVGLPHVWLHDLRKFHATWLLDHGLSDLDVAIQLRHVDGYGRPNAELVRKVYGFADVSKALQRIKDAGSTPHRQEGSDDAREAEAVRARDAAG